MKRRRADGQPKKTIEAEDVESVVGKILATWDIWGVVKVESMTDFPERFSPQREVFIAGGIDLERRRMLIEAIPGLPQ